MKTSLKKTLNPHIVLLGLAATIAPVLAAETTEPHLSLPARIFQEILPVPWQKRPLMRFNVFTEMTEEGRKRTAPTPEKPLHYISSGAKYGEAGVSPIAGERPPSPAVVESAMKSALAANNYLPTAQPDDRPEVLILLSYGSNATDPSALVDDDGGSPAVGALELANIVEGNPYLLKDVIERAGLAGGEKFASGLKAALEEEIKNRNTNSRMRGLKPPIHVPVSPDFDSPLQQFILGKNSALLAHLAEVAFHTCYFVIATAYDFDAFEQHRKLILWRTKMTVEAQGVEMDEVIAPLIANTGTYLGRETTEAAVIAKRIDREGRVDVGTPTVVGESTPAKDPNAPRTPAAEARP